MHDLGAAAVGVANHGPELDAAEYDAFLADALRRVEDRARGIELDGDGDRQQKRRKDNENQGGKHGVEDALEDEADLRHRAAMQGDGRKLADVFDGAVPGQAVVEVGNHAQIDPVHPSLLQNTLDDAALAGSGEEDLVDELLARVLEESFEVADDVF